MARINSMKKLILLLPVIFVIILSGCTTQDAAQIMEDSLNKIDKLDSFKMSYDYMRSMVPVMNMDGDLIIYQKGDLMRSDMEIPIMIGVTMNTVTYYLPEGTFACIQAVDEYLCVLGDEQSVPFSNPESMIEATGKMVDKGVLKMNYNGISNVAGRNCFNITFEMDITKLNSITLEEMEMLGIATDSTSDFENLKEFMINECYDTENGVSLSTSMSMTSDLGDDPEMSEMGISTVSTRISMEATSFTPNAVIDDSMFVLPSEPMSMEELENMLLEDMETEV
ncbi:outer membrane lipoprotein carrier protein LolA [Candidatus Aenigmatarchaeota archaeon]